MSIKLFLCGFTWILENICLILAKFPDGGSNGVIISAVNQPDRVRTRDFPLSDSPTYQNLCSAYHQAMDCNE